MNKPDVKYTLLVSVATYISFIFKVYYLMSIILMFQCIGLFYDDKLSKTETDGQAVDVEGVIAPYIDAFSNFRDKVRKAAQDKVN